MGCDIHLRVQGFRGGVWEYVRTQPFPKYGQDGFSFDDDPASRDYRLFGFLADVRHHDLDAQFPSRGLPEGVAGKDGGPIEYDDDFIAGDWYLGEHSFTHATLAELLAAPWPDDDIDPEHPFRRWICGPEMAAFAVEYGGAENVRVLMGFDS